jgi:branched-chain amino acid transport system substrate-binding protein
MKKYYSEGALDGSSNAYAYGVAQTLVHVLKPCGNDLSRENIMRQAAVPAARAGMRHAGLGA